MFPPPRRPRRRRRLRIAALCTAVMAAGLLAAPAATASGGTKAAGSGDGDAKKAPATSNTASHGAPDHVTDAGKDLPKGWRTSADRAVTLAPDSDGVHVLAADSTKAYRWRTVTTLVEPGFDSDLWTGNFCLADRSHAVVVYAPREFADTQELMERGAFTAIVDLDTGKVHKLAANASLAYFDPSCDPVAHTAAITQLTDDRTRVMTVDTRGATRSTATLDGEITSAVPDGDRLLAASGNKVVSISRTGRTSSVATASGTPYGIRADKGGGVDFLDSSGREERAHRVHAGHTTTLATGAVGTIGLAPAADGRVFLTGTPKTTAKLPAQVARVAADPQADLSTEGGLAVRDAVTPGLHTHVADRSSAATGPAPTAGHATLRATVTATGADLDFSAQVAPTAGAASGAATSPSLAGADKAHAQAASAATSSSTVDADRSCSIARNDPAAMALQPTPNQVEWAVDMAVRKDLTSGYLEQQSWRSAEGLGTSVDPQGMFPLPDLNTGGQIPSQVLLGILAQESNLWQATSHADPGEFGDPLIGNFYGTNIYAGTAGYDPDRIWKVDWDKSDCGYGVGQVTDGMRMAGRTKPGETALPADQQRALALDYTANIAYAARLLAQKWNELHTSSVHLAINDDDPSKMENWFAAVWDYNSGFNAPGTASNWGLGWYNNPANPIYPSTRHPFLDGNSYSDAAKPQQWPYEEKVEGWGAWPIDTGHSYDDSGNEQQKGDPGYGSAGYAAAWWTTDLQRSQVKPPIATFCATGVNDCDINDPPTCEVDHSGDPDCDTPHWWHASATWKPDCSSSCGHGQIRYVTLRHEPGRANPAPPPCDTSALPSGSVVVDDVPSGTPEPRCPVNTFADQGTFTFSFPEDEEGHYESREDLWEIGGGFDGHYWFSHGREPNNWDNLLETTGTWKPTSLPTRLYQVKAYMPFLGSKTKSALYQVDDGSGHHFSREVNQDSVTNGWVTVGYFQLGTGASVTLTNVTGDGSSGDTDVAYDALAFVPFQGTWQHHTFDAVSIFPSDIDLDTSTPSQIDSPMRNRGTLYDWAHSVTAGGRTWDNSGSLTGLTNFPVCVSGTRTGSCVGPAVASAASAWSAQVEAAGTDPGNSPSQADWMGFSNPTPPSTIDPDNSFTDDSSYKIKTHIDAQYVTGPDGKIVPGSEQVTDTDRTGNTDLAQFVLDFVHATVSDYGSLGVTLPDLSFTGTDPNSYGATGYVANPLATGVTPGQAYVERVQNDGIDSSGTCLDTKIVSGGSLGYRMLDAQDSTDANLSAWVNKLYSLALIGQVPQEVADAAGDMYNLFFKKASVTEGKLLGSFFNMAPPIWQDVSMAFCADGTVKPTHATDDIDDSPTMGLVFQSYMPDMYLYLDGHQVDESGHPSSGPVQRGDFALFSNIPGITGDPDQNAYGLCAVDLRGNGGNPWEIQALPENFPVGRPKAAEFCDGT